MTNDITGQAPSPDRRSGRARRRAFGTTAVALVSAASAVLPLQAPADAAVSTMHTSVTASIASVAGGATAGLSTTAATGSHFSRSTYEHRLQVWANRARHSHGVRRIDVRPCHDGYAERWAGYLARNKAFYHQDLGPYMDSCHLSKAGEILALGPVTPNRMVRMWLGSPEHRRILLDPSFRTTGIAARRDGSGDWIGCIDFGRR